MNESLLLKNLKKFIRSGNYKKIENVLKSGLNINTIDSEGWSPLRIAAWSALTDIVKLLICYGADVDFCSPDGRTALRAASWVGNAEVVKCLLKAGADVNKADVEGRTALVAAVYMGHLNIVELLISHGADVNHSDFDGRTALHVASMSVQNLNNQIEIVLYLLENGAQPNKADYDGMTALIGAAFEGYYAVCETCLEFDADVNAADKLSNTALTLAVLHGHYAVVKLLLFWGANVDGMNAAGHSLLSMAVLIRNTQIVHELLARGLDEGHRDHSGCTPLHLVVVDEGFRNNWLCENAILNSEEDDDACVEIVRLLLDAGAYIQDKDLNGNTVVMLACQNDNIQVLKVLVNYYTNEDDSVGIYYSTSYSDLTAMEIDVDSGKLVGPAKHYVSEVLRACVNEASHDGCTPLRAALLKLNKPIVKMLLVLGANPNCQDTYGRTVLYILVLENIVEMAEFLLHLNLNVFENATNLEKVDLTLADNEGRTPLHVASWMGRAPFVRLLLKFGIPVDLKDCDGQTPLQLAAWQGHADICKILIEEGNACVDAVSNQGATALYIGAQEGHLDVCSVLIKSNANPLKADFHKRTPYLVALKANHYDIYQLIVKAIKNTQKKLIRRWSSNERPYKHDQTAFTEQALLHTEKGKRSNDDNKKFERFHIRRQSTEYLKSSHILDLVKEKSNAFYVDLYAKPLDLISVRQHEELVKRNKLNYFQTFDQIEQSCLIAKQKECCTCADGFNDRKCAGMTMVKDYSKVEKNNEQQFNGINIHPNSQQDEGNSKCQNDDISKYYFESKTKQNDFDWNTRTFENTNSNKNNNVDIFNLKHYYVKGNTNKMLLNQCYASNSNTLALDQSKYNPSNVLVPYTPNQTMQCLYPNMELVRLHNSATPVNQNTNQSLNFGQSQKFSNLPKLPPKPKIKPRANGSFKKLNTIKNDCFIGLNKFRNKPFFLEYNNQNEKEAFLNSKNISSKSIIFNMFALCNQNKSKQNLE